MSVETELVRMYRIRLKLTEDQPLPPNLETLQLLTERHLACIPFETLSMHMLEEKGDWRVKEEPVFLEKKGLIDKILKQNRGGCCLELNGLFALLLKDLGYSRVRLLPCSVWAGPERGHCNRAKFRTNSGHASILVRMQQKDGYSSWLVDVGLGEPPAQPLAYGPEHLNQTVETSEGMQSRVRFEPRGPWRDGQGRMRTCLILEWWRHEKWEPRLQWDILDAPLEAPEEEDEGPSLESFRYVIPYLVGRKSPFARKLIVCKLTNSTKLSLSGRTLKSTTPRFGPDSTSTFHELSEKEVRTVLAKDFGIVLQATQHIDLSNSDEAKDTRLWEHL